MRLFFLAFAIITFLQFGGVAQNAITRSDFEQAYYAGIEKGQQYSRTHRSKMIAFRDGSEVTDSWEWEYEMPYRHRLVFVRKTVNGEERFERISLEEKTFCRTDDSGWRVESGSCTTRLPWMITQLSYMLRPNSIVSFTSERSEINGQKATKFRESGHFKVTPPGKKEMITDYESSFWLDAHERIIKQQFRSTSAGAKDFPTTWDDEYEYRDSVKVKAPVL